MRKSYFLASYKKVKGACLFLKSYLRWKSLGIRVLCTHSFNHPSNYWVPTVLGGGTSPKGSVCPHRTFILVVKTEPELLDSDQRRIRWRFWGPSRWLRRLMFERERQGSCRRAQADRKHQLRRCWGRRCLDWEQGAMALESENAWHVLGTEVSRRQDV